MKHTSILRTAIRALKATTLALALTALPAAAQEADEYRMEAGAAAGMGCALTDVNSALFGNPNIAGGAMLRFILNPRMAVKTALTYTRLGGSADPSGRFYPADPNTAGSERLTYNVSGGLADLSAIYELHFLPYGYERGYQGYHRIVPYIQAGFGLTYSDAGKAFTVNIPIGIGLKYKAARRLNIGLEWAMHLSLSDKLEGLSAPLGIKTSGFRGKDHYGLTLVSLTYDISPRCPNCNKD